MRGSGPMAATSLVRHAGGDELREGALAVRACRAPRSARRRAPARRARAAAAPARRSARRRSPARRRSSLSARRWRGRSWPGATIRARRKTPYGGATFAPCLDASPRLPSPRSRSSCPPPPRPHETPAEQHGRPAAALAQEAPPRIHDIQGAAHRSPWAGRAVAAVPGVGDRDRPPPASGCRTRCPTPTPRPPRASSCSAGSHGVQVGDAVEVAGDVTEFRPGGDAGNLTMTEIAATAVTRRGTGAVAPAVDRRGRPAPAGPQAIEDDANGDVERPGVRFDPRPRRARLPREPRGDAGRGRRAAVVGPTQRVGELPVVADAGPRRPHAARRRGDPAGRLQPGARHPRRRARPTPRRPTSATRSPGPVRAVVDYCVRQLQVPRHRRAGGRRRRAPARDDGAPGAGELPSPRSTSRTSTRPTRRRSSPGWPTPRPQPAQPDLVVVEEVQDDNGPPDGGADAAADVATLIAAIAARGRPGLRLPPDRPRPGGRTAASRAATSASASCSAPTAAWPSSTARAATPTATTVVAAPAAPQLSR